MPAADEAPSERKHGSSYRDELAHYKAQYEQLEAELSDFQTSSRELETELEKDIEASEKRERKLKEKVDSLRYEAEEWKTKYKQSKAEANSAQNNLQKEITSLRDANRTFQLKLRDIEVANDDYERQARNTTSSLEDMESKFNMAIEREVLLEEEMRSGEQEREGLRIENQRLRDELSDLKVETDIIQEKLRQSEGGHGFRRRKPIPIYGSPSTPQKVDIFDSPSTVTSSPVFSTPPPKASMSSSTATPPSPPISEASSNLRRSINVTPSFPRSRAGGSEVPSRTLRDARLPHRPSPASHPHPIHSRASSLAHPNSRSPSISSRTSATRSVTTNGPPRMSGLGLGLPKSGSLYQIRGLIGKMQRLEERVQSAKSRLPAPSETSSRGSRSGSIVGESPNTATITARTQPRKRLSGSSFGSSVQNSEGGTPSYHTQSRTTYGARDSRPSSRTSYSSRSSFSQSVHSGVAVRPESRSSRPGAKTPLGHYSVNPVTESRRPRSSLSNNAGQSSSNGSMPHIEEDNDQSPPPLSRLPLGFRRPSVSATPLKKRTTSGFSAIPTPRNFKTSIGPGRIPERNTQTDLGETF